MAEMKEKGYFPKHTFTVSVIRFLLFSGNFLLFFGFFSINNPQILRASRTAAITITTYVVLALCMSRIYGGFAIGRKRPRDIIIAMMISTVITDFVTYFELEIMNVNRYKHEHLQFTDIDVVLLIIIFQLILAFLLTYLAHNLYFKHNPPENCLMIVRDLDEQRGYLRKFRRYKKEFAVKRVISCDDPDWHQAVKDAQTVFIMDVSAAKKAEIIDYSYKHHKDVYMTTELPDVVVNCSKHFLLDDLSMLSSSFKGLTMEQRAVKRALDLVVSVLGIIITSPIMLVSAIAIKACDGGPVFYKQERLTRDGNVFFVLKFRTMRTDAEKTGVAQLCKKDDDRVTPVGKVLRKIRMDELPQLFNVFCGQMSVVGPRPERPSIAKEYYKDIPEFQFRLRAKAGLTGLAQIMGKYNTTPRDKLMLDLMYIERYSIWEDIMIIFQTILVFFKSDSTEGFDETQHTEFTEKTEKEK